MSQRKLAATMFADIVGYTTMMQNDEAHAVDVQTRFKTIIEEFVPKFAGQIIQFYGDGCLLLFESATVAVECAKALQISFINEGDIPVRIGIHSGDVLLKEGNAYGNSVNVASRIESMAIPGSVLFSKIVADQIRNKQAFKVHSLGNHQFKNVKEALEVFALDHPSLKIPDVENLSGKFAPSQTIQKKKYKPLIWSIIGLGLLLSVYFFWPKNSASGIQKNIPQYDLAILPFQLNGPEEMNYLSQGIPDILTIMLEGAGGLRVFDRSLLNASIKNGEINVDNFTGSQLSKKLGVNRYVSGSINTLGSQLDLSAILFDQEGNKIATANERGKSSDDVHLLVDGLAKKLIAKNFDLKGDDILKTAALSSDLEAMKYFLNGEQKMRSIRGREAIEDYKSAFEKDSTFALALYRLVYLENVMFRSKGNFDRIQKLRIIKQRLPKKYQLLADALFLYLGKNAIGSISAYREIVSSYPDDNEANFMAGQSIYHFNRLLGRPISESKPFFQKVLKLDPTNRLAIHKLWLLDIMDGNCRPSPLEEESNLTFANFIWASNCTEGASLDSMAAQIAADPNFIATGLLANFPFDDEILKAFSFLEHIAKLGGNNSATLIEKITRGQANEIFELNNPFINVIGTLLILKNAGHPEIPNTQRFYPKMKGYLKGSEQTLESLPFASKWNTYENQCILAFLKNEEDTFQFYKNKIDSQANLNPDFIEYAEMFDAYLSGIRHFRVKKYVFAEEQFAKMDQLSMPLSDPQNQFYERPLARFMRGDIRMHQGKYEEALGWYENFMMEPGTIVLLPWTFQRRAHIYEKLGRISEALEYYNKFLDLLSDADINYQDYIESAKEQRDALIRASG